MKIVSITMVKNEADIIELFVRGNLMYLSEMYIVDHQSDDKTLNILKSLKAEGLPIKIFKYNSYAYDQGAIFTEVLNKLRNDNSIDYAMFLDADQIIQGPSIEDFKNEISNPDFVAYGIYEMNYVIKESEVNSTMPIDQKIRYRVNTLLTFPKIIINLNAFRNVNLSVLEGGHEVLIENNPVYLKNISNLYLAHLNLRSYGQIISKITIGCLSYILRNVTGDSRTGGHWFSIYKYFLTTERYDWFVLPTACDEEIEIGRIEEKPINFEGNLIYTDVNEVNALDLLIEFFRKIIYYNHDEESRKDLLELIDKREWYNQWVGIVKVAREADWYIRNKGIIEYNSANLEETE